MPCNDGCNTPKPIATAADHRREAKRLETETIQIKKDKARAKGFVYDLACLLPKRKRGIWVLVLAESNHNDVYNIKGSEKEVLAKFKEWVADCEPVPDQMNFQICESEDRCWVLSWHRHKGR
jgi:hypothetical protein